MISPRLVPSLLPYSLLLLTFHLYSFLPSLYISSLCPLPSFPLPYPPALTTYSLSLLFFLSLHLLFPSLPVSAPFYPRSSFHFLLFPINQDHVTLAITPLVILSLPNLTFNPSTVEEASTTSLTSRATLAQVGCYQWTSFYRICSISATIPSFNYRMHIYLRGGLHSIFLFVFASFHVRCVVVGAKHYDVLDRATTEEQLFADLRHRLISIYALIISVSNINRQLLLLLFMNTTFN